MLHTGYTLSIKIIATTNCCSDSPLWVHSILSSWQPKLGQWLVNVCSVIWLEDHSNWLSKYGPWSRDLIDLRCTSLQQDIWLYFLKSGSEMQWIFFPPCFVVVENPVSLCKGKWLFSGTKSLAGDKIKLWAQDGTLVFPSSAMEEKVSTEAEVNHQWIQNLILRTENRLLKNTNTFFYQV